ncbi:GDP-mannose 4,6-dehydratase, partial [Alphaproteobacteria bacterium]|nr:GDP-mannose 4,6-dehydratase [Alphaproteobacteria bacterium]
MKINKVALITGSAGFVGFHLSNHLVSNDWKVIGIDAMTDYYDVDLKRSRHNILKLKKNFFGYKGFIQDERLLDKIYTQHKPNIIIHLAAQPGVRYSIENPHSYIDSNILG